MQVSNPTHLNFMVACCKKKHVFALEDVIRLEASSNYTLIHTVNSRPLVVAKVLAAYEELLEGLGFIRVHRSHLINTRFVKAINASGTAVLKDDRQIKVSRRRRKEVIEKLAAA
jgi:two-component system LytT family response regulator